MADQKHAPTAATATKAQPPRPPEVVVKRATDDTAAKPASVPPPVPTVFTPPSTLSVAPDAAKELKEGLNAVYGKNAVANAALDAEIERVKALIKDRDKGSSAPVPADALSREQKLALFHKIFEVEKRINDAKAVQEAAGLERTKAVLELITAYGGKLGKWTVDGVGLKARIRGDGAYLLRPDEEEADNI
jgi:hypothetical protein